MAWKNHRMKATRAMAQICTDGGGHNNTGRFLLEEKYLLQTVFLR